MCTISCPNKRRLILLVLLAGLLLAGCTRSSRPVDGAPEVTMTLALEPDPPLFGRPCQIGITLLDDAGEPIDEVTLHIKGDMTHAGMVPVYVETSGSFDGQYLTLFEWTMGGDWILTVTGELPDGRTVLRTFEVWVGVPGD